MTLHLEQCFDTEQLHTYLKEQLHFPEYYGRNLDALHDCLSEIPRDTHITVTGSEDFLKRFGQYGQTVLEILKDLKLERPITIR